jgi:aspartate carbamoyltransferase regulatory subunit
MSFSELVCHLDAKGGKSSFVSGYFPTVQIYIAKIIDGTKIDKLPFSLPGLKVEIAFIPNAAFVKKQAVVLSVPVTGYLQAMYRNCILPDPKDWPVFDYERNRSG